MTKGENRQSSDKMIRVRIRELQRRTLRFFGGLSLRDSEYDFAYRSVVGNQADVLEVGGCDSILALRFAKRGYSVTEYDYRKYPERHRNIKSIQGDFLANSLPDNSYDFVVMVSVIEHIGFGSYGAPIVIDGDLMAMEEARRVLRPSGRIVLTIPFASKEHHVAGFERWYDVARVKKLFAGMHVRSEEYYVPHKIVFGRIVKWVPASLEQITTVEDVVERYGYECNACYVVSPAPSALFPSSNL